MPEVKTCMVEGCGKPKKPGSVFCDMHEKRMQRHGDLTHGRPTPIEGCMVEGCARPHRARGCCDTHYRRLLKYGDPEGGPGRGKGPRPNRKPKKTTEARA